MLGNWGLTPREINLKKKYMNCVFSCSFHYELFPPIYIFGLQVYDFYELIRERSLTGDWTRFSFPFYPLLIFWPPMIECTIQ